MLRNPDDGPPTAVFVDPSGRRRRFFRAALLAITLGWVAVVVLVVVGLTAVPSAPRTVLTAPAANQNSPRAVRTPNPPGGTGPGSTVPLPPTCSQVSMCASRGCKRQPGTVTADKFGSVRAAFDGYGVAPPNDTMAANFDCRGFSFQAGQLIADGFGPGDQVAVAGQALTLPKIAADAPDEIIARGQVIHLDQTRAPGGELGFLGAAEFGTQSGTVTVTYVGGSTTRATLRLADWYANAPAPGSEIAATAPWNVPADHAAAYGPAPVSVYYTQIRVNPARKIVTVTLPKNADLHLFAIGVPAPARHLSVAAASDDEAIAPASAPGEANFDGTGHSYDATALAAKGMKPGARVAAKGVKFTWPRYAPGRLDNVRAEGQTILVPGAGRVLGFLGAATLGTQRGPITIHYADGSSQSAMISFADWRASRPAAGDTVVTTTAWNRVPGTVSHRVSVYAATVPLEAGKIVSSVTLPVNFNLHLFAIAEGR